MVLVRAYKEHRGRWTDVMEDPSVVETGLKRHQVERHINYKKTLARKQAERVDEPDEQELISTAATRIKPELRGAFDDEFPLTISSDEEEEAVPVMKREATEELVPTGPTKRPRLDDGNDASGSLDADDALSHAVPSASVQSAEDMKRIAREMRAHQRHKQGQNKQQKQQAMPRTQSQEEDEIQEILTIKKESGARPAPRTQRHQESTESQATVQVTMQMMALHMMQRMMRDMENDAPGDEEDRDMRSEVNALKQQLVAINTELATLRASVQALEQARK